ncbi:hypothetical protein OG462_41575 [Streptomyces sp. NBC_01077]|uniref:hypothetical protein n=1 Tax=Streptomyces sp. NBC_01077 TaxID=2903746 RepID=UPI0038684DCD|nr:hypothetical protein OG462_41575 [Streptomyces sp. NBC_01077]
MHMTDADVGQARPVQALLHDGEPGEGIVGREPAACDKLLGPHLARAHPRSAVAGDVDREEHGRAVQGTPLSGLLIADAGFERCVLGGAQRAIEDPAGDLPAHGG